MSDWNDSMIAEFRENNGTTGTFGRGMILMHTTGAKSGEERLVPVVGFPQGGGWLVTASAGGAPRHPDWYYNLTTNPDFPVDVAADGDGIDTVNVKASEITDNSAYDSAWSTITTAAPSFLEYPKTAEGRQIPIFQLTKV